MQDVQTLTTEIKQVSNGNWVKRDGQCKIAETDFLHKVEHG